MKIGILTYFWGINPGTALQAYSTLSLLKRRFKDSKVEIINYQPKKAEVPLFWNYLNVTSTTNKFRTYKMINTYNLFRRNELQINTAPLITKDYLKAIKFINDKYDLICVGSDTVWEISTLMSKNLAPFPNIYWLSPEITAKKVAFSVSSGTTTFDQIANDDITKIKSLVNSFNLIGVRDDITEKFVKRLNLGNADRILRTPDPTFSYEIMKTGIKDKLLEAGLDLNRPIVGVNLPLMGGVRANLLNHLKESGYQVLSFNAIKNIRDVFLLPKVGPHEWAELYKYLALSITDRFHGTVFSLKNLTPVIAIDCNTDRFTSSGDSKTLSLLKEFNIDDKFHFNIRNIKRDQDRIFKCIENAASNFDKDFVKAKLEEMNARCVNFIDLMEDVH